MMKYIIMPSLKRIVLIKLVTTLWDRVAADIELNKDSFFSSNPRLDVWQQIEDKVVNNVKDIPLPTGLKKQVANIVKPIGLQILSWLSSHNACFSLINLPTEICWTSNGTINTLKTAKVLVEDANIDLSTRFLLACCYCLEDHIFILWEQLKFVEDDDALTRIQNEELVLFWNDIKTIDRLTNVQRCEKYTRFVEISVKFKKEAAINFFLQKLPHKYREKILVNTSKLVAESCQSVEINDFTKDYYANILFFLLSLMDEKQQAEVFKFYSYEVLVCSLHWPWQDFFMETVDHVWTSLLKEDFHQLLLDIVCGKIEVGYKDYDYQNLFGEFWNRSSYRYKKFVISQCCSNGNLLSSLFQIGDERNIKLIFLVANTSEREEILFNENICERLRNNDVWEKLQLFFCDYIASKNKTMGLRNMFPRQLPFYSNVLWNGLFEILNDAIEQSEKECSEGSPETMELQSVIHNMELKENPSSEQSLRMENFNGNQS